MYRHFDTGIKHYDKSTDDPSLRKRQIIARECRRRLRLVDELAGPSGNMGLGGVNYEIDSALGKFSVSDRHPIGPKLPKTSIIDIALHVCEVISEGKLQMSE